MNHLTIGVYTNKQYVINVVREEDLEHHIEYNKTWRFGRLLYVDGKRVYDGCMKPEYLQPYDELVKKIIAENSINMNKITVPYT